MKTVYLCGAINGCSDSECKDWREKAKLAFTDKLHVLDPMRRDYRGKEDESVNAIVHGDYDDLDHSNIVLAAADKPSWGTAMEIHDAFIKDRRNHDNEISKPTIIVICGAERISPWLRYHSHKIVKTLDEGIAEVLRLA